MSAGNTFKTNVSLTRVSRCSTVGCGQPALFSRPVTVEVGGGTVAHYRIGWCGKCPSGWSRRVTAGQTVTSV